MAGKAKADKRNFPFMEVHKKAVELIQQGVTVRQKFTCDNCGTRQTMETPNVFYETGRCEECNHITNIKETGCNYMTVQLFV